MSFCLHIQSIKVVGNPPSKQQSKESRISQDSRRENRVEINLDAKGMEDLSEIMRDVLEDLKEAAQRGMTDQISESLEKSCVPRVEEILDRSKDRKDRDTSRRFSRGFHRDCRGIMSFARTLMVYSALIASFFISYIFIIIYYSSEAFHYLTFVR